MATRNGKSDRPVVSTGHPAQFVHVGRAAWPFSRDVARRQQRLAEHALPMLFEQAISWERRDDKLEVVIELTNSGKIPTTVASLCVEAAPFGAFARFTRHVGRIEVPSLAPGARRRVALSSDFGPLSRGSFGVVGSKGFPWHAGAAWLGNLNVWFDRAPECAVELHRAFDLRVQCERRSIIGLFLPDPLAGFRFDLASTNEEFYIDVVKTNRCWRGSFASYLAVVPPSVVGDRADVELRVTRQRDGETVFVSFSFVSIDGEGDELGCDRLARS